MALDVEMNETASAVTVRLTGDLDISSAPKVEAALQSAEGKVAPRVVLDLSTLSFIDSSGLRVVLSADKRARDIGKELVIVPRPEQVNRIFRLTHVDQRLTFVSGADGA